MKNVVLVGFPGSGKTTIGKKLANFLHLEFRDLDVEIEERYHSSIPHIFEKYGENTFRECEYDTLQELLSSNGKLIATGGGTPCFGDAMQCINRQATSVYLKLSEKVLLERLLNSHKKRPLTDHLKEEELGQYIHDTLQQRAPYYEQASIILEEEKLIDLSHIENYFAILKFE